MLAQSLGSDSENLVRRESLTSRQEQQPSVGPSTTTVALLPGSGSSVPPLLISTEKTRRHRNDAGCSRSRASSGPGADREPCFLPSRSQLEILQRRRRVSERGCFVTICLLGLFVRSGCRCDPMPPRLVFAASLSKFSPIPIFITHAPNTILLVTPLYPDILPLSLPPLQRTNGTWPSPPSNTQSRKKTQCQVESEQVDFYQDANAVGILHLAILQSGGWPANGQ